MSGFSDLCLIVKKEILRAGLDKYICKKITPQDKIRFKVPHVGWRTLMKENLLIEGIDIKKDPFFFCHKYYVKALGEPNDCTFTYD